VQCLIPIDHQVMTDPDAPSPSEPTMRELLHWYGINLLLALLSFL
jgi:hypothetical protein